MWFLFFYVNYVGDIEVRTMFRLTTGFGVTRKDAPDELHSSSGVLMLVYGPYTFFVLPLLTSFTGRMTSRLGRSGLLMRAVSWRKAVAPSS